MSFFCVHKIRVFDMDSQITCQKKLTGVVEILIEPKISQFPWFDIQFGRQTETLLHTHIFDLNIKFFIEKVMAHFLSCHEWSDLP